MLKKRIIPCLDVKNGRTVKGVNFENLRDAGDAIELAALYAQQGADELVFLDITATIEERATFIDFVKNVAKELDIPFTVGGGINSKERVSDLLKAGADKVSINSSAVKTPDLINELSLEFGSQCIVVAVDTKRIDQKDFVFVHAGKTNTGLDTFKWLREVEQRGAGEILLTSMDHDGTKSGFDNDMLVKVADTLNIPIIASGGAGSVEHFIDVFEKGLADAALAASVFHFGEIPIPKLKEALSKNNIPVRL